MNICVLATRVAGAGGGGNNVAFSRVPKFRTGEVVVTSFATGGVGSVFETG